MKRNTLYQWSMLLFVAWFYAGDAKAQFQAQVNETKHAIYGDNQAGHNRLAVTAVNVPGILPPSIRYECALSSFEAFVPGPQDWTACSNDTTGATRTLSNLPVQHGMNYVHFRAVATNILGVQNTSAPASASWFVDARVDSPYPWNVNDNGEAVAVPNGPNSACNPVVVPIHVENGALLDYRVGNGPVQALSGTTPTLVEPPYTSQLNLELEGHSLGAGESLEVYVWIPGDRFGHTEPEPATPWTVRCEDFRPVVEVVAPFPEAFSSAAELRFESTLPDVDFYCSLNGAPFEPCTSPWPYEGLLEGLQEFEVYAEHPETGAGLPAFYSWNVSLPSVTLDTAPSDSSATVALFRFSSNDAGAQFECSLDGVPFGVCTGLRSHLVWGLAEGAREFSVRAVNSVGASQPVSHTWNVLPPSQQGWGLSIGVPVEGSLLQRADLTEVSGESTAPVGSSVFLVFSQNGTSEGVVCEDTDAQGNWRCEVPAALALGEGAWQATVTVVSGAEANTASVNFGIVAEGTNLDLPTVTIEHSGGALIFRSSQDDATFWCSLDDAGYVPCDSPYDVSGLPEGGHKISVYAEDSSGQRGEPTTYEWTTETTGASVEDEPPYKITGGSDIGCSSASGAPLAMLALAFWALARRRSPTS